MRKSSSRYRYRTGERRTKILSGAFVRIPLLEAIVKTKFRATLAFEDKAIQLQEARGVRNNHPLSAFFAYKYGSPPITLHVYLLLDTLLVEP